MRRHSVLAATFALALGSQGGGQPARLAAPTATIDHEFTRIVGVRELGPDRVLVADGGERSLLAADWGTKSARPIGRNGRGPGEYAAINFIYPLAGDSTLLVDGSGQRWLLLRRDSIVVTVPPDTPAIRDGARIPWGADTIGHVLATRQFANSVFPTSGSSLRNDSTLLLRLRRHDGKADTLTKITMRQARVSISGTTDADRRISIDFNPVSAGDLAVLFPDGWIAVARVAPYRVEWVAPGGRLTASPSLPFERVAVTDREKSAMMDLEARLLGRPRREPASITDWPENFPPFLVGALVPADNGHLWIRRAPTADHPETMYDVVDRKGARVARFTMGANERVAAVSRTALYSVLTDDDGIQHLRKHPLPRY